MQLVRLEGYLESSAGRVHRDELTRLCDGAGERVVNAKFGADASTLGAGAAGIEVDRIESRVGFDGFFGSGFGAGTCGA